MLTEVSVISGIDSGVTMKVKFDKTDEIEAQYGVTMSDCLIEYQTADAPNLAKQDVIQIGDDLYVIDEPPRRMGNGDFSVVGLNDRLPT